MKQILLFVIVLLCLPALSLRAQIVYASLSSGNWSTNATWETFSNYSVALAATPGTGTAATTIPSGTHNVLIRNGHTISMNASNRGCKSIIIQSGGKLWANETAARRLQIGAGGTGFTYPLVDTVQIDGILGGSTDGIYLESGTNAQEIKISGSGSIDIQRIRLIGGSGAAAGGSLTVNIDANINLWQAANYAFSACYNPQATDNYVVNINAGKTLAIKTVDGYFHSNSLGSGSGFGNYTYNINGTLDLSASTQASTNLTAFSPTGGTVNVNIAGILKTGVALNASPTAPGVANIKIATTGLVDANLATVMNVSNAAFKTEGNGKLRRTVAGDGSRRNFPVAAELGGNNTATISRDNAAGTSGVYSVNVATAFTNAPPSPSECVNRQWDVALTGAASASDTLRLSWLTADQAAGFNPAGTVSIIHWTGAAWEYFPATVTGSGTMADPYVARAVGITNYSPFGVTSSVAVPVKLLGFAATYNGRSISLNWSTANEINASHFIVEKSTDGTVFNNIAQITANNRILTNNYNYADAAFAGIVYYRLKIVDKDGSFTYSKTISLNTQLMADIKVYPNPAQQYLSLVVKASNQPSHITIVDAAGMIVQQTKMAAGVVQTTIDISGLPKGTYRVAINNAASGSQTAAFIKQ